MHLTGWPLPYAVNGIIQHEWDVDHLNVWITFPLKMYIGIKPAHNLWLCTVDDIPKDTIASSWQDEFTILLTVDDVNGLPGRVLLAYDGPNENLRRLQDKIWEPFGPILSVNIPLALDDIVIQTAVGGLATLLLNKTGAPTIAGTLVCVDSTFENAVRVCDPDSEVSVGALLDSAISDSSKAWVCFSGKVNVLFDANGASAGDWIKTSPVSGRARSLGSEQPGINHFREIGYSLEHVAPNEIGKIMMHFN